MVGKIKVDKDNSNTRKHLPQGGESDEHCKDNRKPVRWLKLKCQSKVVRVICVVLLGAITILLAVSGLMKIIGVSDYSKIVANNGRTNVLILGKAGGGNSAPDLTDTIIFVSVSKENKSIRMLSVPRDIWIPEIRAKINSAYYWGNQENSYWGNQERPPAQGASGPEGGIGLANKYTSQIVGQPVHYAVVIDFSGFKEVVDVLGGVEVDVERSFVDEKYPIPGRENDECGGDKEFKCRYEILRFVQGKQVMNGETALKFVRSRNSEGDEGTDLAREARQQKVISAIEKKVLSFSTLLNPFKMLNIWKVARKYIETDLDGPAIMVLGREVVAARKNIKSFVFPEEFLINPPKNQRYDYQYVFISKKEDWSDIHRWVSDSLE